MEWLGIILIVLLLVVVGGVAWAVSAYNGFVKQRNLIQESWRQVDVELNRRYELIPNLVETVSAFASHERGTLESIVRLRSQAQALASGERDGVPTAERAQVEEELSQAVRGLMVSVEAYPDLKSNTNFLELQRQLAETEDRIAAGRRYYNANVRNYNTRVESVPSNILANMFSFQKATYFEVNDAAVRRAPDVTFGELGRRGDEPSAARPGELGSTTGSELPNPQALDDRSYGTGAQQPPAQPQRADRPDGPYQPPTYGG